MRIICFRGKSFDSSWKWVYGNLEAYPEEGIYQIERQKVDENTIGQFTGFEDINGNNIYEGDVLRNAFSSKPFGIVKWHERGGYFFIDCSVLPIEWNNSYRPLGEMIDVKIDGKPVNLEIIGNIYDNPNLFAKEKISSIDGHTLLPISDCPEEILKLLYSKRIKCEDGIDEPFETYKTKYRIVMADSVIYCDTNDKRWSVVSHSIEHNTIDENKLMRYTDAVIKEKKKKKNRFGNK